MKSNLRKLSAAAVLLAALAVGCQTDYALDSREGAPITDRENVLFKLPLAKNEPRVSPSQSKLVRPDTVTVFTRTLTYLSAADKPVVCSAKLTIPPGAVTDTVTVTVALDTVWAGIKFQPAGLQFAVPAELDMSVANLDPFAIKTIVAFLYVNPNGTYGEQEFEQLRTTGNDGKIMMKSGKIRHFSAYAFGRRNGDRNGN
jgi:hypothetical protein